MKDTSVCKWVTFCGLLIGLGVFCSTFVLLNQWDVNRLKHEILSILAPESSKHNTNTIEDIDTPNEIQRIIETQREMVRDDMIGYKYPYGEHNISATKLEDLLIEENGIPIRSLIVSTWRSGSTFLGAILDAHPGNFYFFEPLVDFKVQIRGPPLATKALDRVKELFSCKYADEFIEIAKIRPFSFNQSTNFWKQCRIHKNVCYDDRFLTGMCKLFPFQSMKLVRLRLNIAQELLSDEELAVRIVLLVRDPRGILQSRSMQQSWCSRAGTPCTTDPTSLCADLVSDHTIAMELLKKYPTTFRMIRYEDLAIDPYEQVKELYKFYGRYFHPNVKTFLDTHTTVEINGPASTYRNSKTTAFHWRNDMKFEEVEEIQRSCSSAMKLWGYLPATNATHMKEFNPLADYVVL